MTAAPKSNADRPLYFVSIDPTIDTKQIRDIKYICVAKIRWANYKNPKQITQCYRCQWFHHGTSDCHRHPRCVKCTKNHLTKDCDKTETGKPQCTNCYKDHPANSTECEIYKQELEKTQLQRRSRTTQRRTNEMEELTTKSFPPLKQRSSGGPPLPTPTNKRANAANTTQQETGLHHLQSVSTPQKLQQGTNDPHINKNITQVNNCMDNRTIPQVARTTTRDRTKLAKDNGYI